MRALPRGRVRLVAGLAAVVVAASACQASVRVDLTVHDAGSGTVGVTLVLDPQATAEFSDLRAQLQLNDLRQAGWTVTGPTTAADGTTTVTARRAFGGPGGAAAAISDLTGPSGPLHTLAVRTRHSFLWTTTEVHGAADLRGGLDAFVDPKVAPLLGVPSLHQALAMLATSGGDTPRLPLEVDVHLPGRVISSDGATSSAGGGRWSPQLGQMLPIDAVARQRNGVNLGLAALSGTSALLLVLLLVGRAFGVTAAFRADSWDYLGARRRRRRRRARHPSMRGRR